MRISCARWRLGKGNVMAMSLVHFLTSRCYRKFQYFPVWFKNQNQNVHVPLSLTTLLVRMYVSLMSTEFVAVMTLSFFCCISTQSLLLSFLDFYRTIFSGLLRGCMTSREGEKTLFIHTFVCLIRSSLISLCILAKFGSMFFLRICMLCKHS